MKKISKILSVVLAILMVVCALPISVSAQNVTLTIESSKNDIKAGETVTVDVVLSENSNLNYFTLDLVYDNNKLEYVSTNSCTVNGEEVASNSSYANKIRITTASVAPITAGGAILSVNFKALSSSCSTVSLNVVESGDGDFKNIPISTSPMKIHSFGEWIKVTEPSCEDAGENRKTCTCGEFITDSISANGHTEVTLPAVEPTCTETGLTAGVKCSACDEMITAQTTLPATGHDYQAEITKVPTHTENGEKTFTCNNCGGSYTETIEADGTHKHISAITTEPTCTEKGVLTYTCACGDSYTEEIPANGHSVADNGYCETCEEKVCDHNCHKGGISGFFWKITNFFNKLFGSKKYCDCGLAHY